MRLIDVDALCDEIESVEYSGHDHEVERICSLIRKAKWIDAVPVRHGKWIDETFKPWGLVYHPYKCDQCGEHSEATSYFCPYCGAKMGKDHE